MLRLTLAQMRRSLGRLAAAGIAIMIGTAFLAATLLAGNVLTRTTVDALTTTLAEADLVVGSGPGLSPAQISAVQAVPQVEGVESGVEVGIELTGPGGLAWASARTLADHPRLESATVGEGRLPAADDEIALPRATADRLDLSIDALVTSRMTMYPDPGTEEVVLEDRLTVVGLLDDGAASVLGMPGSAIVDSGLYDRWTQDVDPTEAYVPTLLVAVADGAAVPDVQATIREAVGDGATVRTQDEQAEAVIAEMTGQTNQLTAIVLAFGAVALLVAALVIANTFQVLVAQRTRTLALLRCVGADRGQLRRSVVIEALILGVASSLAGLVLGTALVQVALAVLGSRTDVPVPGTVSLSLAAVLVPILAGVLVTVTAALAPARAATRVSPLAALAPVVPPQLGERGGRLRAWSAGLLVVGGGAGLALGMVVAADVDLMAGLGLGVLGGAVSFVGILVAAVFWVPRVVGGLGRLTTRVGGTAARLAAANSVRNPRRTSATSAALLIGVTLVAMMATGAASTRAALDQTLDERFAVDVDVKSVDTSEGPAPLPTAFLDAVRDLDGVGPTTLLTGSSVTAEWSGGTSEETRLGVAGLDVAAAQALMRAPEHVDGLADGTVLVSEQMVSWYGLPAEGQLTLRPDDATADPVTLDIVTTPFESDALLLTADTVEQLDPGAAVTRMWLILSDLDSAYDVVTDIEDTAADLEVPTSTTGAGVERAFYQRVVDTLLAVVVGLLGVAVVIALVGVANTLSLSVIERRRESATLRAIGLSKRQLRGTLAVEGLLIALVGALVGSALGTLYGWAGARTLMGELVSVALVVPWAHLGLVLLVAVVAGLAASVLPGRSAARTSPVEALAVD